MTKAKKTAPVRAWVVLAALAAILLLAAGVCALHWVNAVSLRGEAALGDYARLEATGETLDLPTEFGRERVHALYEDEDGAHALHVSDPWKDGGVIYIEGTLVRLDQPVGEVNVRVGLIPEKLEQGIPAKAQEKVILLNTQMVRRNSYARLYGYDDHCGFYAAVEADRLYGEGWQYRVALVDETDGAMRIFETGMTLTPIEGGLAFARANQPQQEEAQYAQ